MFKLRQNDSLLYKNVVENKNNYKKNLVDFHLIDQFNENQIQTTNFLIYPNSTVATLIHAIISRFSICQWICVCYEQKRRLHIERFVTFGK